LNEENGDEDESEDCKRVAKANTYCEINIEKTEIEHVEDRTTGTAELLKTRKRGRPAKVSNIAKVSEVVVVAKRKRGRPKKTEKTIQEISERVSTNDNKRMKREKTDRKEIEPIIIERGEASSPVPVKRKPRMASLNALAKVNAVLENYRFERTKDIAENIVKIEDDRSTKDEIRKIKVKVLEPKVKVEDEEEEEEEEIEPLVSDDEDLITPRDCSQFNDEDTAEEENVEEVFLAPSPPPPPPVMLDQAIQTDKCTQSRALQTERFVFPIGEDAHAQTFCTCHHHHQKSGERRKFHSKYDLVYQQSGGAPLHVRSTVLAQTPSHTLALPIIKARFSTG